ncbi:SLAP domain-containing protein [Companilactobacillus sp. HBUAS56257]|uniref:SLAP domain-containing protein n=1 Tax=Companilactobacillus sp. HBUAS56257 TaxID=3109360 RepID=UPI002FF0FC03
MKLLNKCLLLTSLFTVGVAPVIATTPVQAASTKTCTVKSIQEQNLYFLVGKDKLVKARDVKIVTNGSPDVTGTNDVVTSSNGKYSIEVTVPNATTYNLKGEKLPHDLLQGTTCSLGGQKEFANKTYYQVSEHHIVPMTRVR